MGNGKVDWLKCEEALSAPAVYQERVKLYCVIVTRALPLCKLQFWYYLHTKRGTACSRLAFYHWGKCFGCCKMPLHSTLPHFTSNLPMPSSGWWWWWGMRQLCGPCDRKACQFLHLSPAPAYRKGSKLHGTIYALCVGHHRLSRRNPRTVSCLKPWRAAAKSKLDRFINFYPFHLGTQGNISIPGMFLVGAIVRGRLGWGRECLNQILLCLDWDLALFIQCLHCFTTGQSWSKEASCLLTWTINHLVVHYHPFTQQTSLISTCI